jgi:hypothetical protein
MTSEAGQILHNNPAGFPASDFVAALITSLRSEIARVYWNVNQKSFYDAGPGDIGGDEGARGEPESAPRLGIPGVEWWPYYNWGGSPEDADWDQAAASRPNFSFEGVEVRWYKHFGRSLNVNVVWPAEKWVRWFERCRETLRAWEGQRGEQHGIGDPSVYPDPAGAVPLTPEAADLRHIELMRQVYVLQARIDCIACVCIDVAKKKSPRFEPGDWRWCEALDWVVRLGRHALLAPGRLSLHAMTRAEAIQAIGGAWSMRDQEFICSPEEQCASDKEYREAMLALGVTDQELNGTVEER